MMYGEAPKLAFAASGREARAQRDMKSKRNGKDHCEDRQGSAAGSQDSWPSVQHLLQHRSQHHKSGKKLRACKAKVISQMSVRVRINQCVLPATTFLKFFIVISIDKTHRHLSGLIPDTFTYSENKAGARGSDHRVARDF